ncbi:MAG: hypothetical protein ACOCZB_05950 [Spirochaetota bacterium]
MRKVKAGIVHIGRERFEAGAILPDTVSEPVAEELERAGVVESDRPRRSEPKRKQTTESEAGEE